MGRIRRCQRCDAEDFSKRVGGCALLIRGGDLQQEGRRNPAWHTQEELDQAIGDTGCSRNRE